MCEEDKNGNNLLHHLMLYFDDDVGESRESVFELINAGINTNHYNNDDYTPLHYAIKYKQIEAVKFCIQVNKASLDDGKEEIFNFQLRAKHNYT